MRRFALLAGVLLVAVSMVTVFGAGAPEEEEVGEYGYPIEVEEWLQEAALGPYQEAEFDEEALYQAALDNNESVLVYAGTSRMARVADSFEEKYPGISVTPDMAGTAEVIEKFQRESEAGRYEADVVQASQAGRQLAVLYNRHHLFPYVPGDVAQHMDDNQMEPVVHWRYGSRQWIYNDYVSDGEPFTNLWELTDPEWEGRVVVGDPRTDGGTLDYFTLVTVKHDDMERAYEQHYGESPDTSQYNAGEKWVLDLFDNNPVLVPSERDIPDIVGNPDGQDEALVGLIAGSRFRSVGDPAAGDLRFFPTLNTVPTIGNLAIYPVGIAYKTENPNAAKLFVRHLFGDSEGGEGWEPFHVPGNWPGSDHVTVAPDHPDAPELMDALWPRRDLNFWTMDRDTIEAVYQTQGDVLDLLSIVM